MCKCGLNINYVELESDYKSGMSSKYRSNIYTTGKYLYFNARLHNKN